ncbi:uncharacterized protein PG986_003077 [Apiospora aurea]|uniref:MADS-box domain-containing protein n=1 Tax=Apiospora aurea TaxID=335848 RepID=A0ABR1QQN8_9PEZI
MGRRKIEIKAIKDDRNRSVTFLKRKGGLFKKAHELSVLCSVDVAVFIFGSNKKLYEYSSGDMRELITRYTYVRIWLSIPQRPNKAELTGESSLQHGGPNEHKGPTDFNGGDDDDDEDGDATPPHGHEGSLRGHTPSASPPINGVPFVARGHTPQPQMGSRPSSRTDFRRPTGQHANGYAYMPHPAIYNPQGQPGMSSIPHMAAHQPTQFPYPPPQHHQQPQPPMPQYMDDRRSSVPPPSYSQGPPQNQQMQRPQASPPQPQPQQLPQQPQPVPHMSPPQPQHQHLEPPQIQHHPPPQPPPQQEPQQPLPPMEPRPDAAPDRPNRFLDTTSAIKKLPARKQHSIFTPIDENRSILSQHLESFGAEPRNGKDESAAGGNRAQSVDVGAVQRNNDHGSPPPPPQRSNTSNVPSNLGPGPRKSISGSIPETTFTPPSRSNSLRVGGGAPRPKLKVQIPDEASEAGSNTQDSSTSPANPSETATQANRRSNAESHGTGPVLPPPSPSASALLSAGATGPPKSFRKASASSPDQQQYEYRYSCLGATFPFPQQ